MDVCANFKEIPSRPSRVIVQGGEYKAYRLQPWLSLCKGIKMDADIKFLKYYMTKKAVFLYCFVDIWEIWDYEEVVSICAYFPISTPSKGSKAL